MASEVDQATLPTDSGSTRPRSSSISRSRPTTPLRRISASSLRSLSLSHSRSRTQTGSGALHEPPLQHLSQLFAELADSVSDLTVKLEDLSLINNDLDGFNQAFASYLYGLRINAYTADFLEAPTKLNFDLAARRQPPMSPEAATSHQDSIDVNSSPPGSPSTSMMHHNMTMDSEHSFKQDAQMTTSSSARGGSTGVGRGRGRGRGGKVGTAMTKKKREELAAFSDSIIQLMPIKFREDPERRAEVDKVIAVLRNHPGGLCMSDFGNEIKVPSHRVNDSLTALVRAKIVLKVFAGGLTTYRFDPLKVTIPTV
ncbi:DASH complex subunit dam1 [Microbotryomycetes sp. JL221]|nr:DASH complex subunit dam1 [Microbotryomycetes sp. JL221]